MTVGCCSSKSTCGTSSSLESTSLLSSSTPTIDPDALHTWQQRALILSVITILYNLAEGTVSLWYGEEGDSMSLMGFGTDSFIEVFSACMVFWRFHHDVTHRTEKPSSEDCERTVKKERVGTMVIGVLMCALAIGATSGAVHSLMHNIGPNTGLSGIIISSVSIILMLILYINKLATSIHLNSSTIQRDADCSLNSIQLSSVLLIGSAVFHLFPKIWWFDSATAIVISALIAKEGIEAVIAARSPDFDGGGCCLSESRTTRFIKSYMSSSSSRTSSSVKETSNAHGTTNPSDVIVNVKEDGCCCGKDSAKLVKPDGCCAPDKSCSSTKDVPVEQTDDG